MDDTRDPRPRGRARTVGAPIGRRPARSLGVPAAVVALVCAVTACGSTSTSTAGTAATSSGTDSSSAATASSTPASSSATGIVIEFDGRQVEGSLDPSPTSASLLAQLPLELGFGDHAGQEKSARLPMPLSLDGAPERSSATPLTIGYYAPDQVLVLYYEPVGTFAGIVPVGTFDDLDAITSQTEDFTATLRRAG